MKVLELKGLNSFYAAQSFHKLILGLKMLPAYLGEDYAAFYDRLDAMPLEDQEKMIREALIFVKLDADEQLDLLKFSCDANGVPYGKENSLNLRPEQIHDLMVGVCLQIAKEHKINLISKTEKKNSKISQLI